MSQINFKGFTIIHNSAMGFYFIEGIDVRWSNLDRLKQAILKIEFDIDFTQDQEKALNVAYNCAYSDNELHSVVIDNTLFNVTHI